MTATTGLTTQIYQVFIKATPDQVWEASSKPEMHGPLISAGDQQDGKRRHRCALTSRV